MKPLRNYVLIAVVIMLVYVGLAYRLDRDVVDQHERNFNQQQAMQTQLSVRSIEDHVGWILGEFRVVAAYALPPAGAIDQPSPLATACDLFMTTLHIYPEEGLAMGFFTSPDTSLILIEGSSGPVEEAQQALKGWLAADWDRMLTRQTALVTPFTATPDQQLYGVLLPVFQEGEFAGVLAGVLNFAPVLDRYLSPVRSWKYGSAWVQDARGIVIYDHETQHIGQNVLENGREDARLQQVLQRMAAQDQGQSEDHFSAGRGEKAVRNLVAWDTVYLGDQRLTLVLAAPSSEINSNLRFYRRFALALGLLLGVTLVGSGSLFYLTRQRVLERRVAERTQALESLTENLERRVAERTQELDLERARLRTILEAMDDGVIYREKGEVKYVNLEMCRILGYSLDEFMCRPREIYEASLAAHDAARDAEVKRQFREALRRGTFWRDRIKVQRKDGSVFDASIFMALVKDSQGEVVGIVEGLRDVSQETALQEQRELFIANASHELRRPLSNLKARLYLLARQPDKVAEHLGVIQKASDDMADLVQDLVEVAQFSREDIRLDRKRVVLQHALNAAVTIQQSQASRKQVLLASEIPDLPIHVFADHQRLVQMFNNLISSAVQFTPQGGRVQVRLFTRSSAHESWAVVQIQDSGPGISPEQLPFIFDPFFRPSEGDSPTTGLELTLARHIVDLHRGLLTVESDAQQGSTFTVQLSTDFTPLPPPR